MYSAPDKLNEPKYTKNGTCMECGRYSLLNQWKTCKKCDLASKKNKRPGYLKFPHKKGTY